MTIGYKEILDNTIPLVRTNREVSIMYATLYNAYNAAAQLQSNLFPLGTREDAVEIIELAKMWLSSNDVHDQEIFQLLKSHTAFNAVLFFFSHIKGGMPLSGIN